MPHTASQTLLRELDKKLWTAADQLQTNLDAADYKHADPRSGGLRAASSCSSRPANRSSPLPDTFTRDQHPDLRADFVMANPPFNIEEWWNGKLEGDARWNRSEAELTSHAQFYKKRGKHGTPPRGNANFAWVQHMLQNLPRHSAATTGLAPNGSMALLLANGSMSSNSSGEGDIRRALIEADLVECMVALPELWN